MSKKLTQEEKISQEDLKSIFFHNLSNKELSIILTAINKVIPKGDRDKFVFARTTKSSLKMTVEEWIEDTAEDHLYLLENPPSASQRSEAANNTLKE